MEKKKYKRYSDVDMQKALEEVSAGCSVTSIARKYNIPRITLLYKVTGKYEMGKKSGAPTVLTKNEEDALVKWAISLGKTGFPVSKTQLIESITLIMKTVSRKNPFTDNKPGRKWYSLFLKRHPELSQRISQNLTASRAAVSEQKIRDWFNEVEEHLKNKHLEYVLQDPSKLFNGDETAFFLCPKKK